MLTVGKLISVGMNTYMNLIRKSKAKNIREDTRTSIYEKINTIEDSIDELITNRIEEFSKREIKMLIPKWQQLKELR